MHKPRHRPRRSARLSFSLLSVLALVAFACLPAFAQAECTDSSCAEYEVEIPTAEGKDKKKSGKSGSEKEPSAQASNKSGGNTGGGSPAGEGSEESEEGAAGGAPGKNNGGGPGDKNGSPAGGNSSGNQGGAGEQEGVPVTETGEQASSSSGGSSPLVPILIAVAVLAAISIGAVIYRQRRQGSDGSGSPVSPNA